MKKILATVLAICIGMSMLAGCGSQQGSETPSAPADSAAQSEAPAEQPADKPALKVGMVCNAKTIDDKSFNQATWAGITRAAEDFGIETKYLIAADQSAAGFLQEIANLYDAGFRMIITPGYTFSKAIFDAQKIYPDCKFVILDSAPQDDGAEAPEIAANTAAIDYAAQESGFVAASPAPSSSRKASSAPSSARRFPRRSSSRPASSRASSTPTRTSAQTSR